MIKKNNNNIKFFLIKLISITLAVIIIINVTYNLILADKMEAINNLFSLSKKENIEKIKNKLRNEIRNGLKKEKILNQEDKQLILNIVEKIKSELKD